MKVQYCDPGSSGAEKVAKSMVTIAKNGVFKRGYDSGAFGINLKGRDISTLPHVIERAELLGKKIVRDIMAGKSYKFQNLFHRSIAKLFLKPNFKKFIRRDRETKFKAVYTHLAVQGLL